MRKKTLLLIALLIYCSVAKAQTIKQIDDSLVYYLEEINNHTSDSTDLQKLANYSLMAYLEKVCVNNPSTINANFSLPRNEGLKIVTSDDGNVRIYCWNAFPGPLEAINGLIQYRTNAGIKAQVLYNIKTDLEKNNQLIGYCTNIYSVISKKREHFYIVAFKGKYSEGVKTYQISDNAIDIAKKFKTENKSYSCISYDFEWRYDTLGSEIHLSKNKKKLFIPIVNNDRAITDKYLVYVFDGNNYVFDKNAK